ncbi:DUF5693 family protein [Bacillus cereus]
MKRWMKHLLVAGVVTTFGLSIPNVVTKYKTENSSNTVEIAVDYKQIYLNAKGGEANFENQIHKTLQKNGVTSIGFTENSLYELENRNLVYVMNGSNLERNLWSQNHNISIVRNDTYVLVPAGEKQKEIISTIEKSALGETKIYTVKDTKVIEINKKLSDVYKAPMLYLESDYKELKDSYHIIPRISNEWGDRYPIIEKQLKEWDKKSKLSPVVFLGSEAEGYSEDEKGKETVQTHSLWKQTGVGIVESFTSEDRQKGAKEYAVDSDYNIVRAHSVSKDDLEGMSPVEMKRMIAKAAKERNIRLFYINPFYEKSDETDKEYVDRLGDSIDTIDKAIKNSGFKTGQAAPFVEKENPLLSKIGIIASLLGAIYLFCLALYTAVKNNENPILNKLFPLALGSGTLMVVMGYLSGSKGILIPVASLGLSILLPVWASLHTYFTLDKKAKGKLNILKDLFAPIASLYVIGISYLISMNHGIPNVTYIAPFKGVSLTLSIPPIIVGLFLIASLWKSVSLKKVAFHKIRVIDVVIIAVLGAFLMFYESRSGNGGTLLPFEEMLRGWLEDSLPWRPRTKEIFFAFPLLMLMVGLWKDSKWTRLALPFVTVGFASVFNTFTHFHTPMIASAGRSVISITFGLFIGLVMLIIIKAALEIFGKSKKSGDL